jgi:signal transduction histidine kinase
MHQVGIGLHSDRPNLSRLRWAGVAIPLLAIIAGETARYLVPGGEGDMIAHVLWGAAAGAGVILFALSMFWSIGRAEREMVRHNHELGAVNAVSAAVQDAPSTDALVAAAVRSIVNATGAARASVQIFPADGVGPAQPITWEHADAVPGSANDLPVELPLTTGSAVIGLLRVWLPGEQVTDLSTPALQNISHQLGCAIQLHRLVEDLQRRQAETSALYELAIQISDQRPLADTLAQVTRTVRSLLRADEVAICLTPAASVAVIAAHGPESAERLPGVDADGRVCMTATSDGPALPHRGATVCPVRSSPKYRQALDVPIRSTDVELGDIWVARTDDRPFATLDHETLAGLADVSAVAITSAQLRERERLTATVAERERIARELHDSLAQVLGVTHLRLRAVLNDPAILEAPRVRHELDDLADMAQEAFRDVREAILGLREASHVEKGFLPGLAAYLEKFGRQASIRVRLDAAPDLDPDLGPHSEIQLIRVIQEALANVRKHAEARSATVRVSEDASGTTIEIEDDGRGFDTALHAGDAGGYGLTTMRERMALVGGSFWVDSSVGTGTRIVAHIPRDRRRATLQEGGAVAGEPAAPHPAGR